MDYKTFNEHINKFNEKFCNNELKFRKYQKEIILDALNTFFNTNKKTYVYEGPVGSGKSIVGIIFSYVANQLGKTGYILTSELSLQDQYESDFEKFKIGFHGVKGVDNYICTENGEKYSIGDCTMRNIPYNQRKKLHCYKHCPYLAAREKAIHSPTTLLNYSYHLIQRNYVAKNFEEEPFKIRDFVICDEGHKIVNIIQNHFSPRIDILTNEKLEKLRRFIKSKNFGDVKSTPNALSKTIDNIFIEDNKDILYNHLFDFEYHLSNFETSASNIKEFIAKKYRNKTIPKDWRSGMFLVDWVKDMHCKFEDYNEIIKNTGIDSLIKNKSEESVVFNCLDESYLMEKHFHNETGFKLIMSATFGNPKSYIKNTKISNAKFIRSKSIFNFDKSPIYVFSGKKMNYNSKDLNFPWVVKKIEEITNLHQKESGIIHTGSYEFARKLNEMISDDIRNRFLFYGNSEEKKILLEEFYKGKDKILIGPSILEGVDFYDERSRFQIFMKVPYLNLANNFVKEKMIKDQDWYNNKAILHILQGIGRSVRNENDWAKTYILDGCFVDLFKRNQDAFSKEIYNRLIWVSYDNKNWNNVKSIKINI